MSAFDPILTAIHAEKTGTRCFVVLDNTESFFLLNRSCAVYTDFYKAAMGGIKAAFYTCLASLGPLALIETNMGTRLDDFMIAPDSPEKIKSALTVAATAGVLAGIVYGIEKGRRLWDERSVASFLLAQNVRPIAACVGLPALTENDLKERPRIAFLPTRHWNNTANGHDFVIRHRPGV